MGDVVAPAFLFLFPPRTMSETVATTQRDRPLSRSDTALTTQQYLSLSDEEQRELLRAAWSGSRSPSPDSQVEKQGTKRKATVPLKNKSKSRKRKAKHTPRRSAEPTVFSSDQINTMEAIFQIREYPSHELYTAISKDLNLRRKVVRDWFGRRRKKARFESSK